MAKLVIAVFGLSVGLVGGAIFIGVLIGDDRAMVTRHDVSQAGIGSVVVVE